MLYFRNVNSFLFDVVGNIANKPKLKKKLKKQ